MEWANSTKYNSFNSYKGLTYYENYKNIVAWLNGETDKLMPPVECNLDPVLGCNLNCYFCITQSYMKGVKHEQLPAVYIHRLINFLAKWGVRGLCLSGGGEPSLHKALSGMIYQSTLNGMDAAVVTNATIIDDELAEALMECRWVALSVDSGDWKTYKMIKGANLFDQVVVNISRIAQLRVKSNSKVDLCFKFLIIPENQHQIYNACKLAKELGVQDFHARPVDFEREDIEGHKQFSIDLESVKEQFERCHKLNSDDFHVYTITHKFDDNFHVKYDYSACLAAPVLLPILTDGNAYICVEHKMEGRYRLGSCYPNPEQLLDWWGSDNHRQMIKSIVPGRDCSRCIYSGYNQQIEQVIMKDGMCLSFP